MSDLLVKPGQWNSFSSSAVESFLAAMSILLGLTPKRKAFIEQIHQDIHGHYKPDEYYIQSLQNLGRWPLSMQLQYVMKECNDIQKKQFPPNCVKAIFPILFSHRIQPDFLHPMPDNYSQRLHIRCLRIFSLLVLLQCLCYIIRN